jgi:hypothetical protein
VHIHSPAEQREKMNKEGMTPTAAVPRLRGGDKHCLISRISWNFLILVGIGSNLPARREIREACKQIEIM